MQPIAMIALEVVGPGNNFIGGGQSIGSCGGWGGPRDEFTTKNKVRFSHNLLCNIAESFALCVFVVVVVVVVVVAVVVVVVVAVVVCDFTKSGLFIGPLFSLKF